MSFQSRCMHNSVDLRIMRYLIFLNYRLIFGLDLSETIFKGYIYSKTTLGRYEMRLENMIYSTCVGLAPLQSVTVGPQILMKPCYVILHNTGLSMALHLYTQKDRDRGHTGMILIENAVYCKKKSMLSTQNLT